MADTEKSAVSHTEARSAGDLKYGDVALDHFSHTHDLAEPIDPEAERKLLRKIDWMVIPFICVTYLITYIDKATLGYAAVFGLADDLHLVGNEFSWLGKQAINP